MRFARGVSIVFALLGVTTWLVRPTSAHPNRVQAPASDGAPERSGVVSVSLPTIGGTWNELTALPYNLENPRYRAPNHDQYFAGSGYGFAGGRIQALAVDGDTVYAGAAGGGVWRSRDR